MVPGGEGYCEQADILFGGKNFACAGVVASGDHHFDKLFGYRFGSCAIQQAVKGDDAAERRSGVGLERFCVRVERVASNRHAARVGVFDDDTGRRAGRRVKALDALPRCISVADVVVRQLLALQLRVSGERTGRWRSLAVKRCALVRVLAVAQVLHFGKLQIEDAGVGAAQGRGFGSGAAARRASRVRCRRQRRQRADTGEVTADRAVIRGGVRVDLRSKRKAGLARGHAIMGCQFIEHARVVGRIDDDGDVFPVFGRRADHRRAADVDVFNRVFERAIGLGHGLRERIQIDAHQINIFDAVLAHFGDMLGQRAPPQQRTVDFRVQGFDAAIEHLGEAGVVRHLDHGHVVVAQDFGGAAGRKQTHAALVQRAGEFDNAGLVGH